MTKPLNDFCTLQARGTNRDALNQPIVEWVDVLKDISCSVDPLSGRALIAAQQKRAEITHEIEMHFRPGVTADLRVLFKGRPFEVLFVRNPKERGERLVLMCTEGVTNG